MRLRRGCEHLFNCTRDSHEGNAPLQEGLDRHFVGGIQRNAMRSADLRRFKAQPQTGEALQIRLLEIQMRERRQIEGQGRSRPLRVGQRIKNRQPHVGNGDLR